MFSQNSTPLGELLRAHKEDRERRGVLQTRRLTESFEIADQIENNFRAALGKELNSSIANQNHLELTVRQLRAQVVALSRQCEAYGRGHAALTSEVERLESVPFLKSTSDTVVKINQTLESLAVKITHLVGE